MTPLPVLDLYWRPGSRRIRGRLCLARACILSRSNCLERSGKRAAFSLLELLVVIFVIGILASLLFAGVQRTLEAGRRARCAHHLRLLFLANTQYELDHGHYVPAAADMHGANRQRWHGSRTSSGGAFDGTLGPLVPYLDAGGEIRRCPSFPSLAAAEAANAFEASCGGYGYNAVGVGSRTYMLGMVSEAMEKGMRADMVRNPSRTIMFADTAFPQPYGPFPTYLIEYSFVEPHFWVFEPGQESGFRADPSIHFRHNGRANVVWVDGHISAEQLETEGPEHFSKMDIGWFGPPNNQLFAP